MSTRPGRRHRRAVRLVAGSLTATAAMATLVIGASGAAASTTNDTVGTNTQRMSQPTLNSTQHGWYTKGSHLTLECYARGQSVTGYYSKYVPGGWDNLWYKVSDGYYVADIDINTGSNNPVTPACSSATLNSKIVSKALAVQTGTFGGQCATWVEGIIRSAGGPSVSLGASAAGYQAHWATYATKVSWSSAKPGDIIQWYDPNSVYLVHTAILISGSSASNAVVRDSNYLSRGLVYQGTFNSRNVGFHPGTYTIWRVK